MLLNDDLFETIVHKIQKTDKIFLIMTKFLGIFRYVRRFFKGRKKIKQKKLYNLNFFLYTTLISFCEESVT